jgi:hypothetical protein
MLFGGGFFFRRAGTRRDVDERRSTQSADERRDVQRGGTQSGTRNFSERVAARRGLLPEGTEVGAGGRAKRHRWNAALPLKYFHPDEGGQKPSPICSERTLYSGTPACVPRKSWGIGFRVVSLALDQLRRWFQPPTAPASEPPARGFLASF